MERERIIKLFEPDIDPAFEVKSEEMLGVFVDCETTGFERNEDKIIEIGVVPFAFTREGVVERIGVGVSYLEDPGFPIPDEIVKLTGISDADVKDRTIDDIAINTLVQNAAIVIAHNAEFDRQFAEARLPIFRNRPWGCSQVDIDWRGEGYEMAKLPWLIFEHCRMFYSAHGAEMDAYAGAHLLSTTLPSGARVMERILEQARKQWTRLYAVKSPYECKAMLKRRGYKWNDGSNGLPKAWWKDVVQSEASAEYDWLRSHAQSTPKTFAFTSRKRFSLESASR